jgi:hypothetical protein
MDGSGLEFGLYMNTALREPDLEFNNVLKVWKNYIYAIADILKV